MHGDPLIPELDRSGLRSFGLVTGGIVIALFGLVLPLLLARGLPVWPWVLGGVLGAWALVAPTTLRLVYRAWMRFGLAMSRIMIPLLMGLVFYIVVTPLGLIRRALSLDELPKRRDATLTTYRIPKEETSDLKRPF